MNLFKPDNSSNQLQKKKLHINIPWEKPPKLHKHYARHVNNWKDIIKSGFRSQYILFSYNWKETVVDLFNWDDLHKHDSHLEGSFKLKLQIR